MDLFEFLGLSRFVYVCLLVTLKLFADGSGEGFALGVAIEVGFAIGKELPSTIVTLIFCPGMRF